MYPQRPGRPSPFPAAPAGGLAASEWARSRCRTNVLIQNARKPPCHAPTWHRLTHGAPSTHSELGCGSEQRPLHRDQQNVEWDVLNSSLFRSFPTSALSWASACPHAQMPRLNIQIHQLLSSLLPKHTLNSPTAFLLHRVSL